MRISGIQKLTLLDYPGHIAATLFTPGCDLRCPFCHNSELVNDSSEYEYYEDEVLEFLKQRFGKLEGICITGGEPLMQDGIEDFILKVKGMGYKVKLDTNGTFPIRLKSLIDSKLLDYIAMDIKHAPGKWYLAAGLEEGKAKTMFEKTKESMKYIKESGIPYEFRTTIVKGIHSLSDMDELGHFVMGAERCYLQNFTDSGEILEEGFESWDKGTLYSMLDVIKRYVPDAKLRGVD